jgi:hypothetical protein
MTSSAEIVTKYVKVKMWANLSLAERSALQQLRTMSIGYGVADKGLGPVLYSLDLYLEQCKLHLQDKDGTYQECRDVTAESIIQDGIRQLQMISNSYPRFRSLFNLFTDWATNSLKFKRLCRLYILWKLHKQPKDNGPESRAIAPNTYYFTGQVSHFLHCQLVHFVFAHDHVLKDSLSLCRIFDNLNRNGSHYDDIMIVTADVVALYPSIRLEDGLEALNWFMDHHTTLEIGLKSLILEMARFVLTHNYIEMEGIGTGIFLQVIGTAMGTSFSVVYAIIFMIRLESSIIERYRPWIVLFKRFIDDLLFLWKGPQLLLQQLQADLDAKNSNIKFEWSKAGKSAIFLDLNVQVGLNNGKLNLTHWVYSKPLNAYAYLQMESYHPRHSFKGWIKALLIRNLTRSNTIQLWIDENKALYSRLRARGICKQILKTTFESILWGQRDKYLMPKDTPNQRKFDNNCVLSTPYVPGLNTLRYIEKLSFERFRITREAKSIFPQKGTWVLKSAKKLGALLPKFKRSPAREILPPPAPSPLQQPIAGAEET